MNNSDLMKRMGFNITPSAESRAEALRRLAQQRYELAGQYQAEVDRRKAKLDNSPGPEWAQGLTNQNIRDLTKVLRQQAVDAGAEAVATPFGGKIPTTDWELQAAQQAQAGPPRLSREEMERRAQIDYFQKMGLKEGDRVFTRDNNVYQVTSCGTTVSTKLPPAPKQLGTDTKYLDNYNTRMRVLGARATDDCRPINRIFDTATRYVPQLPGRLHLAVFVSLERPQKE